MSAVGLIGVRQPRPRFAKVRHCFARRFCPQRLENPFVECLEQFIRRHMFPLCAACGGAHYFHVVLGHQRGRTPFTAPNDLAIARDGNAACLDAEVLH